MGEHEDTDQTPFLFEANTLALDLVNTEMMLSGERTDLLADVPALARWLGAAGLPADGVNEDTLVEAKRLRAALRGAADSLADGGPVTAAALATLNDLLRRRTGYEQVEEGEGGRGYTRRFYDTSPAAVRALAPVAEAAVRLLTTDERLHVRRCGNPRCILFFRDTSKSHTRRWCSMSLCGNRAKAAAHYKRHKGEAGALREQ